jgi:hypothetical protein
MHPRLQEGSLLAAIACKEIAMASDVRCKHAGCGCPVPSTRLAEGKRSCSDFCAAHEDDATPVHSRGGECGCGHAGCKSASVVAHP